MFRIFKFVAAWFVSATSRTRSEWPFQNSPSLIKELDVARRRDARTKRSSRLAGLMDKADRSSATIASKIRGRSGIVRAVGGDAGELKIP